MHEVVAAFFERSLFGSVMQAWVCRAPKSEAVALRALVFFSRPFFELFNAALWLLKVSIKLVSSFAAAKRSEFWVANIEMVF